MWNPLRPLTLVACMGFAASAAAAQRPGLAFLGTPWRLPADTVEMRLEGRGYTFSRATETHDLEFTRPDSGELTVFLQRGRTVGFLLVDPARGAQVEPRFRALADSLQAALGAPDTLDGSGVQWAAGLTEIRLLITRRLGVPYVTTEWRGPGMLDEMVQRWGDRPLPPLPPGFTAVTGTAVSRVAWTRRGSPGCRAACCTPASASTTRSPWVPKTPRTTAPSTRWTSTARSGGHAFSDAR
jgi:hypothetical protein